MTPAESLIARSLGGCRFLPASWDKRFCRDMAAIAEHSPDLEFTERQSTHLIRLVHKYRRQMPVRVIEIALDLSERAAERRVAVGKGALADFTPGRSRRGGCPRSGVFLPAGLGASSEASQLSLFPK